MKINKDMPKQYAERDIMELDRIGNHYCRHVYAMTAEKLHSKSDIAAELAWRDAEIKQLREAIQEFVDRCERGEVRSKYTYNKFKELLR